METPHYALHVRGVDEDEAAELGRIAELAWEAWQAYFPSPVELASGEVFEAYVEADFESFQARLVADGLDPNGAGNAGGYYHPSTERAYIYAQPTVWFTRVLFLHELAHQAHDRSRGGTPVPGWYVEGLAEFISRHDYDGDCLRLGVTPHLSLEDPPATALDEVGGVDLGAWFDDGAWPGRPLAMELFRLGETQPDLAPGWATVKASIDADGAAASEEIEASLGLSVADLEARLAEFVNADQEPMVPVYLEWLHRTPSSVRGWADGVITVARHKTPPATASLVSEAPAGGAVGLLLSWDSGDDFDALVLDAAGAVWTFNAVGGVNSWNFVADVAPPTDAIGWTLAHEGSEALVGIDGVELRVPTQATPTVGLAVENDDIVFTELSWSP